MKAYIPVVCLLASLTLGCSQKPDSTTAAANTPASVPKAEKPSAPVAMVSPAEIKFAPGQLVQMQVVLETSVAAGDMDVTFSTDSAVQLQNTPLVNTVHLDGNKNYSFPVQLIATATGRYYLNLDVVLKTTEQTSSRNFNVILQVGDTSVAVAQDAASAQRKIGEQKTDRENVVALPATESVHTR